MSIETAQDHIDSSKLKKHAEEGAGKAFEMFARVGYFSKGFVYILVGALSFMAAMANDKRPPGTEGVLYEVSSKPFGEILLWLVAIGISGFIFWRVFQLFMKGKHNKWKNIFIKLGYFISATAYSALAYKAIKLALHSGSGQDSKKSLTQMILTESFGKWIILAVGGVIIGFGLYEFYTALKEKFLKKFNTSKMSPKELSVGKKAGKIGLMARGWVFCIIGYFFIRTAITSNSENAIGMDEALSKIAHQPYGQWMLGLVAVGLFLYGVFEILKGKNRNMRIR